MIRRTYDGTDTSRAQRFIEERLIPPLLHGDEQHQEWLRSELRKWIPDLEVLLREPKGS